MLLFLINSTATTLLQGTLTFPLDNSNSLLVDILSSLALLESFLNTIAKLTFFFIPYNGFSLHLKSKVPTLPVKFYIIWSHLLSDLLTHSLPYFTLLQPNSPSYCSLNMAVSYPQQGQYPDSSLCIKYTGIALHGLLLITQVSVQTSPPTID